MQQRKRHAQELKEHQESADVHKVNRSKDNQPRRPDKKSKQPDNTINKCKFCGGSYQRGKCPAYGKRCHKCHAKTTLKPVVPRRKLTVLLKRTTPFLAPQMMMMNSTLIWSPALAPVQSPAILPLISLPRRDLNQVKQVCLQLTTLNQIGLLHWK